MRMHSLARWRTPPRRRSSHFQFATLPAEVLEPRCLLSAPGLSDVYATLAYVGAPAPPEPGYHLEQFLVRFADEAFQDGGTPPVLAGTELVRNFPGDPHLYLVRVTGDLTILEAVAAYQAEPLVDYAHPDYYATLAYVGAPPPPEPGYHLENFFVRFADEAFQDGGAPPVLEGTELVKNFLGDPHLYLVRVTSDLTVEEAIAAYKAEPLVHSAGPNYYATLALPIRSAPEPAPSNPAPPRSPSAAPDGDPASHSRGRSDSDLDVPSALASVGTLAPGARPELDVDQAGLDEYARFLNLPVEARLLHGTDSAVDSDRPAARPGSPSAVLFATKTSDRRDASIGSGSLDLLFADELHLLLDSL